MALKHFDIRIHRRVQGVFFRASARIHAQALDIVGFTRNESDGSVYIEAEGQEENLNQFVQWCYRGPDQAAVKKVEVQEGLLKTFSSFEVNRGMF